MQETVSKALTTRYFLILHFDRQCNVGDGYSFAAPQPPGYATKLPNERFPKVYIKGIAILQLEGKGL